MPHPANQSCANCLHFEPGTPGECHAGTPQPDLALCPMPLVYIAWPPTSAEGWCGGWASEAVKGQERDAWQEVERLQRLCNELVIHYPSGLKRSATKQANRLKRAGYTRVKIIRTKKENRYG